MSQRVSLFVYLFTRSLSSQCTFYKLRLSFVNLKKIETETEWT